MFKQFHITLNVEVDARGEEEAQAIAAELEQVLKERSTYKLRSVETNDIEEA